jgi:hypothetical protein
MIIAGILVTTSGRAYFNPKEDRMATEMREQEERAQEGGNNPGSVWLSNQVSNLWQTANGF